MATAAVVKFFGKDAVAPLDDLEQLILDRCGARTLTFLGAGQKGSAFATDTGQVVKLTRDKSEANAMAIVANNPTPYIVSVYDVFKLGSKFVKGLIYGVHQERVAKPSPAWAKFVGLVPAAVLHKSGHLTQSAVIEFYNELVAEREDDPGYMSAFTDEKIEWLSGLGKYFDTTGIKFSDFHAGNIMKGKSGNHVLIDLGVSRSPAARIGVLEAEDPEEDGYEPQQPSAAIVSAKELIQQACEGRMTAVLANYYHRPRPERQ